MEALAAEIVDSNTFPLWLSHCGEPTLAFLRPFKSGLGHFNNVSRQ